MTALPRIGVGVALAVLTLAGCDGGDATTGAPANGRPRLKPDALLAAVNGPTGPQEAQVQTKSGEILILGIEGRVVPVALDSAEGLRALGESEARIAQAVKADTAARAAADKRSAQDVLVADFEAQRSDALPAAAAGADRPDPRQFLGARVARLQAGQAPQIAGRAAKGRAPEGPQLVEVTAELKQGVDADTAFAYATCALAGWAARSGTPFARHIRTLQQRTNGRLRVASVFTVSEFEPMGLRVVEATSTLAECRARGIPAA